MCPVGAVSTTTRSNRGSSRILQQLPHRRRLVRAGHRPAQERGHRPVVVDHLAHLHQAAEGVLPLPNIPLAPSRRRGRFRRRRAACPSRIRVGAGGISRSNVSDSECAGSVETTSVEMPSRPHSPAPSRRPSSSSRRRLSRRRERTRVRRCPSGDHPLVASTGFRRFRRRRSSSCDGSTLRCRYCVRMFAPSSADL